MCQPPLLPIDFKCQKERQEHEVNLFCAALSSLQLGVARSATGPKFAMQCLRRQCRAVQGFRELHGCICRALLRQYEQRPPPLAPLAASLRTLSTLCDDLEAPGSTSRHAF